MPPRMNLYSASRSLAIRSRPSIASRHPSIVQVVARRGFAEKDEQPTGPNQDQLPHVSEEAGSMGRIKGETEPDIGQGTPVQDILKRDQEGKDKAPEVIKEDIKDTKASASAEAMTFENLLAMGQMENIANGGTAEDPVDHIKVGHKYGLPELPLPPNANLHYRYDTVVEQVTNLLMRDGKLSQAQRIMAFVLNYLRTAPPPTPNPARPLLSGGPHPSHLPLDPVAYLTLAIDSIAPVIRIRSQKGAAGGGAALQIPVPLGQRQRRRQAVQWILDSANKKPSRGSGKYQFAQHFAEEIIGVVEGKSNVWEKRSLVHKTGMSARANLMIMERRRR